MINSIIFPWFMSNQLTSHKLNLNDNKKPSQSQYHISPIYVKPIYKS